MKTLKKILHLLAVALIISAGSCTTGSPDRDVKNLGTEAKYVFYFIGDGMTTPQIRLAEVALDSPEFRRNYATQTESATERDKLSLKSFDIAGLATTNSLNHYITDSAAAGTALATGHKTNSGMVSLSPENEKFTTIAEMAKQKGMKVGIISSVGIDHATPAAFYAHIRGRNDYAQISDQLLNTGFDYFGGNCINYKARATMADTDIDTAIADYKKQAEKQGFRFITTKAEFQEVDKSETKPVIATFNIPYSIDLPAQTNENNKITLAQLTQKGIDLIDNNDGFFMMVEGGKIDWACHANDAAAAAYEVVAFDEAINVAMDFAQKHPKETLIIITGDHETGGLSMGWAGTEYKSAYHLLSGAKSSTVVFAHHITEMISANASFSDILAFTCSEFGYTNNSQGGAERSISTEAELTDYEISLLRKAYNDSKLNADIDKAQLKIEYGNYNPYAITCTQLLNNKACISFSSYYHTSLPVMVFADGARAELFSGYYDNTDIAKCIMLAAGLE